MRSQYLPPCRVIERDGDRLALMLVNKDTISPKEQKDAEEWLRELAYERNPYTHHRRERREKNWPVVCAIKDDEITTVVHSSPDASVRIEDELSRTKCEFYFSIC